MPGASETRPWGRETTVSECIARDPLRKIDGERQTWYPHGHRRPGDPSIKENIDAQECVRFGVGCAVGFALRQRCAGARRDGNEAESGDWNSGRPAESVELHGQTAHRYGCGFPREQTRLQ